jgi:hypothetical protein
MKGEEKFIPYSAACGGNFGRVFDFGRVSGGFGVSHEKRSFTRSIAR